MNAFIHSYLYIYYAYAWWGCPAGGRFPPGEYFLALGFALLPVSYSLQFRQRPQPNPRTLDEYTPHQYWSATFIKLFSLQSRQHPPPPNVKRTWLYVYTPTSIHSPLCYMSTCNILLFAPHRYAIYYYSHLVEWQWLPVLHQLDAAQLHAQLLLVKRHPCSAQAAAGATQQKERAASFTGAGGAGAGRVGLSRSKDQQGRRASCWAVVLGRCVLLCCCCSCLCAVAVAVAAV